MSHFVRKSSDWPACMAGMGIVWLPGLRVINAMFKALITRLAVMYLPKDQPTTLRLNTSMTTAKVQESCPGGNVSHVCNP